MIARSTFRVSELCCRRYATNASTTPPMLVKIRKDLKLAMQNKDSNRLSVLRSLLTQTLNASKTSNPVNTDLQVLALLRKSANASRAAQEEFTNAGRLDLAEKEETQLKIMEEYARGVEVVGDDEIRKTVKQAVERMRVEGSKINMGEVLKKVFSPEIMGEKPVEKGSVAKIVKEILAES